MLDRLLDTAADCGCVPSVEADRLHVDSDDCAGEGRLAEEPACRGTVVEALEDRDVTAVRTRASGFERAYEDDAAALLVAAGRFAEAAAFHDADLAARARRDPLGAARVASGRGDPLARIAAETGLATFLGADYETALRPSVGPTVARSRVATRPPADATLTERYELDTGAVVRHYTGDDLSTYHLTPAEHRLDADATATLAAAYDRLAEGGVTGGQRAPGRAVRAVADTGQPVETLATALEKHTRGLGALEDCFADPEVTDAFVTAPVENNRIRVRRDGETMRTNVRLTTDGAAALASRFRRASGRAFSKASPTLAATVDAGGRRVRVAGVTDPVSDGVGFTFRAHDESAFRLADLVENGTLDPEGAALLSVAVERGAAVLLAGARGAGKTTLLGALLWELPPSVRTVVIEDTPELPVEELQSTGRDVQPLRVATGDGASIEPTDALRTALRLGDGALVVGEVRGEEAQVLYEAMRVGAADGAVLGTIHGGGGESVRERVVTDLGVPETAFADTDFVVTVEAYDDGDGRTRRLRAVEAVRRTANGVGFETVADDEGLCLADSPAIADLAAPNETAADVRADIESRANHLGE
ncbi:type II/IV secretion system ATPase subunit [Natronomonas halophila]|uniref:ATPase, T2SS/T4P/T4SS family n=1 Tax=Natronomonas halophila TaxID=2747817 RepID=UPI0015B3DD1E|nr:ATPase, T2SS/T4P/T4SS family [Natronomonas halophila]QLD86289.1 type II/IV secretion system ATPase subunit [Natronomonas halophila]